MKRLLSKMKKSLTRTLVGTIANKRGNWFTDHAAAIIIVVVLAVLIMGGVFLMWEGTILPSLVTQINNLFGWT